MFKAAKPTVPPTFDGVDYDDNKALKAAQDAVIREQWVQSMMARLVREELGKCYYREGVNHLEKCGHLRGKSIQRSQIWAKSMVFGESGLTRHFSFYRPVSPAAPALEGQGLPVPAAELRAQGVEGHAQGGEIA